MAVMLFVLCLDPEFAVAIPGEYGTIAVDEGYIYAAPFYGSSLFRFPAISSGSGTADAEPVTFTTDDYRRIIEFQVTPFFAVMNNGKTIERYFFSTGILETVCRGENISSFVLTSPQDLCYADRGSKQLVFLNMKSGITVKVNDIAVNDVRQDSSWIYALARKTILLFDRYGNRLGEIAMPEGVDRIKTAAGKLLAYAVGKDHLFVRSGKTREGDTGECSWRMVALAGKIRDLAAVDSFVVTLDNAGTGLLFYNRSGF